MRVNDDKIVDFSVEKSRFKLLNEHLFGLSVNELEGFLKKKRKRQLDKNVIEQVKELIVLRKADNKRFYEENFSDFFESNIVKLGYQKLDMDNKLDTVKNNQGIKLKYASVYDLFSAMKQIIDTAEKTNKLDLIR